MICIITSRTLKSLNPAEFHSLESLSKPTINLRLTSFFWAVAYSFVIERGVVYMERDEAGLHYYSKDIGHTEKAQSWGTNISQVIWDKVLKGKVIVFQSNSRLHLLFANMITNIPFNDKVICNLRIKISQLSLRIKAKLI